MSEEIDRTMRLQIRILKLSGILPYNLFVVVTYAFILSPIHLILAIIDIFVEHLTFIDAVEIVEMFGAFIQIRAKLAVFIIYQNELKELLVQRSQHFWKIDKFGEVFARELRIFPNVMIKLLKMFLFAATMSVVFLLTKPIYVHQPPMRCWLPKEANGAFYFIVVVQEIMGFLGFLYYVCFSSFFCLIYVDCIVQFKLLYKAISEMETREDLIACLKYQNFLYKFVLKVNEPFGMQLFVQYFSGLSFVLMQMLMFVDPDEDLFLKIKAGGFIFFVFLELSWNYILASMIRDESDKLPTTIWFSNWYVKELKYQKDILFMMKGSQEPISLKAGKMMQIDREALLNTFRLTFSTFTLLSAKSEEN